MREQKAGDSGPGRSAVPRPPFSCSDSATRAIVWQIAIAIVCAIVAMISIQTVANLRLRGIASGFDYLSRAAGFEIARGPLSYSSRDTYARAVVVGLINTLRVALLGILQQPAARAHQALPQSDPALTLTLLLNAIAVAERKVAASAYVGVRTLRKGRRRVDERTP